MSYLNKAYFFDYTEVLFHDGNDVFIFLDPPYWKGVCKYVAYPLGEPDAPDTGVFNVKKLYIPPNGPST